MNERTLIHPAVLPEILAAFASAPLPILVIDRQGIILHANGELRRCFGYGTAELLAQPVETLIPGWSDPLALAESAGDGAPAEMLVAARQRSGASVSLGLRLQRLPGEEGEILVLYFQERRPEQNPPREIERLNRTLRLVHDCNEILVRAVSEEVLLKGILTRMADLGGYPRVWVGLLPMTAEGGFAVSMCAGPGASNPHCARLEEADGLASQAIRAGRALRYFGIAAGFACEQHCRLAEEAWPAATMAMPLQSGGQTLGCLCVGSNAESPFAPAEMDLLQELVDDLAYGLAALRDRAEHQRVEARMRLLERAVAHSANAIIITDAVSGSKHPILYVNPAFEQLTGYLASEVVGRNSRFLLGDETGQAGLQEIRAALHEKRVGHALLKNFHKDGSPFWHELTVAPVPDESGAVTHYISVMNDVTARRRQEEVIARHAYYDALTGLPNRQLLLERVRQAVADSARYADGFAMVMFALNRFSLINDAYGRDTGDALLRELGQRLLAAVRPRDTVARLGGDEFVVLLGALPADLDPLPLIEKISASVLLPFDLAGSETVISASIGASVSPRDGNVAEALIRNAEVAAEGAKGAGPNAIRFYSEDMNRRTAERLALEFGLRRALENNELEVFYQPIIDLASGHIVEAEALLRWNRPGFGMISPARFIPIAEESGLIVSIGQWVLNEACRQNAAWRRAGHRQLKVGVNLSARQFRESDLERVVSDALSASGLPGEGLVLEVTESMLMESIEESAATLRRLKQLGVHLALDDFGTGYSSLAYLKRLPLDTLKIDRSFVSDIATDSNDAAITLTVISMARSMNLGVVAEGVETDAQLDYLRVNGCQRVQGYLFAAPVRAAELDVMLGDQRWRKE